MKKLYIIGSIGFMTLLSVYFTYGNLGVFYTSYYFIIHNLFLMAICMFIISMTDGNIRRLSWVNFGFFTLKLVYEIFLISKRWYPVLQEYESLIWPSVFIVYIILSLSYVGIRET